jgi:hypothetical protein
MKNNHRTIFTQSIAEGQTLDEPTARLIQYFYNAPAYAPNGEALAHYSHVSIMAFSVMLTLEAASRLPQYYSTLFYRELSIRSPVRFEKLKLARLEKRIWYIVRHKRF